MILSACPNCSGFANDHWVIGRPHLMTGRKSGKVFVLACCAFSKSVGRYNSEEEAREAWDKRRAKGSAGDFRLQPMLEQLDKLDWRGKPRNDSVIPPAA